MIVPDNRDRRLVRYLPRRWKKRGVCRRRGCRKRRVHWHWVLTMNGLSKMLKRVYEAPLIAAMNARCPITQFLLEKS